jgi:hypothetical protein
MDTTSIVHQNKSYNILKYIIMKFITIDLRLNITRNYGNNKGQPSGHKQKDHQVASKEGKEKWKGKDKNTTTPTG